MPNKTTVEGKAASDFRLDNDGGSYTVRFGEGITAKYITFMMNGHALVLQYSTAKLIH